MKEGRNFSHSFIEKAVKSFSEEKMFAEASSRLPISKTSNKDEMISDIKSSYYDEQLVLVLGAGVSKKFGLPNWNQLLQELIVNTIDQEEEASIVLAKMFNQVFQPSPLIAGRFLQESHGENKISFEKDVKRILYASCAYDVSHPTMEEVERFCLAPMNRPNLDSIITYNFDDTLEQRLNKMSSDFPYKSIYGSGMKADKNELAIYHVHGFLPQKGKLTEMNKITFSENIYHQQYNDVYSWNNITQINKFRDNTCLFIGTSLNDPNTRRLLDIAHSHKGDKKSYHYVFRKKYEHNTTEKMLLELLQSDELLMDEKQKAEMRLKDTVKLLNEIMESFQENDSLSLGVKTIWVDEYDKISEVLSEIRKPEE
ncbi:MAG: SIR2 family protein [Flavobacteriales bacterium]